MKLSQKQVNEILTLIGHVRNDISFGAGGTFVDWEKDDYPDLKEIKKVENAINTLKVLCIELNTGK